jgi:6-pyruvoyltetrahydropterin/6-carboxytetrahydropterin synthase
MTSPRFTFTRRISMAHRLIADSTSKCASGHGHNIIIHWDLVSNTVETFKFDFHANMMELFATAKGKVHHWLDEHADHSFFLSNKDPMLQWIDEHEPNHRVMTFPGDPTMEMVSACFFSKFNKLIPNDLYCSSVTIEETPTNAVTVNSAYNLYDYWENNRISSEGVLPWYNRNDMSTRD